MGYSINALADYFDVFPVAKAFGYCVLDSGVEAHLVNHAQTGCTDFEGDPALLLYVVEFFAEEVDVEGALCAALRVGNIVADHGFFPCNLTNLRHCYV